MPAAEIVMFGNLAAQDAALENRGETMREAPARRLSKRQLSPTDESNPYRKKYFSYTKNRGGAESRPVRVVQALDFSSQKQKHTPPARDKENKVTNDVIQPRCSNINQQQAAKNLVNKAYKIKHSKSGIKTPKKSGARPRRELKSNFDSDFVYDPPRKKLKIFEENLDSGPANKSIDSVDVKDEKSEVTYDETAIHTDIAIGISETIKLKKKARMKFANEYAIPCFKKSVKMKNHSSIQSCESEYEIATKADVSVKAELDEKNFTDIFLNFCEEREKKASFADLFLQDEGGKYTCLNKNFDKCKNDPGMLYPKDECVTSENQSYHNRLDLKKSNHRKKVRKKDIKVEESLLLEENQLSKIDERTSETKLKTSDGPRNLDVPTSEENGNKAKKIKNKED